MESLSYYSLSDVSLSTTAAVGPGKALAHHNTSRYGWYITPNGS